MADPGPHDRLALAAEVCIDTDHYSDGGNNLPLWEAEEDHAGPLVEWRPLGLSDELVAALRDWNDCYETRFWDFEPFRSDVPGFMDPEDEQVRAWLETGRRLQDWLVTEFEGRVQVGYYNEVTNRWEW